ncbi:MAG TPA: sugar ABC transporter permease [Spirochaetia bacterium]|nr:sugar ABC transporter permease [Spirochaetia bacterium]
MNKIYAKANILYIPVLLILTLYVVYPFFDGIRIAFTNWNGFSQKFRYIGLANFVRLSMDDSVRVAFVNTLVYGFGSTLLQQVLGLFYAVLLTGAFTGRTFVRTVIYLPVLFSAFVMGAMWYYIVQYDDGALNDIVALFHHSKVFWLSQRTLTVSVLVLINTFQYMGVSMVIYIAGIKAIPLTYLEAATVEGAGAGRRFWQIILPLLFPALLTSITINLIGGFKLFDLIMALTAGGPGYTTHSLATLIYATYFGGQQAGFSAAIGLLLFVTILFFTIVFNRMVRGQEVEYT